MFFLGPLAKAYAARIDAALGPKKARFFKFRYMIYRPWSQRWIEFVDHLYREFEFDVAPLDVVRTKFMRSYYSRAWLPSRRLKALCGHYEWLKSHFRADFITAILRMDHFNLAQVTGQTGAVYTFSLAQIERYRAEGELCLSLTQNGHDSPLAVLSFLVEPKAGEGFVMRIGGIQGPSGDESRERVVQATRDLKGWRPKGAVLDAAYAVATAMNITELTAISMKLHPLNQNGRVLAADNDAFFEEISSIKEKGEYQLPYERPVREASDIAAKKRKAWLARNVMKSDLTSQIKTRLLTLKP